MPSSEQDVLDAIQHLRLRVLGPSLFDSYLPDGVLFDIGWNLWEHPSESAEGVRHANALRVDDEGDYRRTITQNAIVAAALNEDQWRDLRSEHANSDQARIEYNLFRTHYNPEGAATSIIHQNTVFSPELDPTGRVHRFHTFAEFDRFAQMADAEQLRVYFHIGMANNDWAFMGNLAFNQQFAMELRTRDDQPIQGTRPIGLFMPFTNWQIGASRGRFISTAHVIIPTASLGDTRMWPHFIFDPTHPDVLALCNGSVRDMVRRFGDRAKGFVVRGEGTISIKHERSVGAECPTRLTEQSFHACAPVANFAPHLLAGFRAYMAKLVGHPGVLRSRWGLSRNLTSFDQIDLLRPPPLGQWDARHPVVAQDYVDFLVFLWDEIGASHYVTAKAAKHDSWCGILGFSPLGVERAGLASDFPATGSFYLDIETYFGIPGHPPQANGLAREADAARLQGKPMAFALSAVPPTLDANLPPILEVWYRRCFKEIKALHFDLWLREVLTAGIAHVSYVKCWVHALVPYAPSMQASNDGIARIRALRERALEFMGPYQAVAVHIEPPSRNLRPGVDDLTSTEVGTMLSDALRAAEIPSALFHEPAVFARTSARWRLRHSVVLAPFHTAVEASGGAVGLLLDIYAQVFAEGPGLAVLIVTEAAMSQLRAAASDRFVHVRREVQGGDFADIWAVLTEGHETRTFLFAFRDRRQGEQASAYYRQCASLVMSVFPTWLQAAEVVARPVSVSATGVRALSTNFVTDGLNVFLGVSWLERPPGTPVRLAVEVDPNWRMGFDQRFVTGFATTFHGGSDVIGPTQTRFAYVEPVLSSTLANAIAAGGLGEVAERFMEVLHAMQHQTPGYQVDHGLALARKALETLQRGHQSRALAALVLLSRAVFIAAQRQAVGVAVDVHAASVWLTSGQPGLRPLVDAEVQAVLPLNAQDALPSVRTDGNGFSTVTIEPPFTERWEFTMTPGFRAPTLAEVKDLIEIHVTDQETGAHTFVSV